MIIRSASFVISNTSVKGCPAPKLPEYAFIGRSNVGKSSLINMLTRQKGLAKTSGKPGKTRLINHFIINNEWYLVDLPGYGYAEVPKAERLKWEKMIRQYILQRENLQCLFVLIDSRHDAQEIDLNFMEWLGTSQIPFSIVFTKTDKLKPSELAENLNKYKEKLLETWEELPPVFITSAETGEGTTEILDYIGDVNKAIAELV